MALKMEHRHKLFSDHVSVSTANMRGIWARSVVIAVIFFIVVSPSSISSYGMNNEPLSRQGCIWSSSKNSNATINTGGPTTAEMSLDCHVRMLNTEFWNYTFNLEQRQRTSGLEVKCNDKLYFESHLKMNQSFSQLIHLKFVSFDSCKIRKVPRGIWKKFNELRSLTIRTHNAEWSPSIALEIESNSLEGLHELTSLDLSSSNVWSLPNHLLCPHLMNLLKFNLSLNRLVDVPDEFSNSNLNIEHSACTLTLNVQSVDLSRNTIRRVGKTAFSRLVNLVQLRLQENYVEEFEDAAFSGIGRLRFLNVSSNRLVALPPTIFKSNPLLRELYLQNNSITALSPLVFSTLDQLVMLDLSLNALSSLWIKESVFSGLGQLIVLKLSSNQLWEIDLRIFRTLINLQALHLDNNRIETIHPEALTTLTNLHLLDLSRNRISFIDSRLFSSGFQLQRLYLDHNKIKTMGNGALDNCTNLQDLGLAGNNLVEIPLALRSGLKYLRSLDIGENRIVFVTNESFEGLEELYGLRLVDNRLIELPSGFCNTIPHLRVLNLAQNRLNKISPSAFTGCSHLRALRLDTNSLEEFPSSLSPQLPSLLWLNVSENRIGRLDYHLLPRTVEWLDLSYNALEFLGGSGNGITEKKLRNPIPSSAFHLRVLDASHNRLTSLDMGTIPSSLETLRINHNHLKTVAPDTFSASSHLRRIELIGNELELLPFSALTFPPVPPSRPLPQTYLAGNPFLCDCSMEWLTRLNQVQLTVLRQHPRLMDAEAIKCKLMTSSGDRHQLVSLADAKSSQFLCPYTAHCLPLCHCCDFEFCDCAMTCPGNCTCYHDTPWSVNIVQCSNSGYRDMPPRIPMEASEIYLDGNEISELGSHIFIGKKNLRILSLNGTQLESIRNKTFNGLKSLEILRLEDNLLTQLSGWEFSDLVNLRELYLQNNLLEVISGGTFGDLKFLQVLRLDGNHLFDFNVWGLSGNGYLNSVSLSANPWSCECEFIIPFRSWVLTRTSIVVDFSLAKCQRLTGDEMSGSDSEREDSLLLSSICNNLEDVPFVPGNEGASNSLDPSDGELLERQAVLLPRPQDAVTVETDAAVNFVSMDLDTSVMWAIILSCGVGVILILTLLIIFRKEICTVVGCRHQRRNDGKSGSRFSNLSCCLRIGGKKSRFHSPSGSHGGRGTCRGDDREDVPEKLFDAYFIYNSEDEDILTQKLIPELEDKGDGRNRFYRLCLHRDLCLGLENPWNLEMVSSAAESSQRIVLLLSKTFLQKEWTNNSDFRRALQSTLSRHQKNLIFILTPPLSLHNLPSLVTIFPELKAPTNPLLFGGENILEWTDPSFRTKLKRLLPHPSGTSENHHQHLRPGQNFSINSILTQHPHPHPHRQNHSNGNEPDWSYTNEDLHPQFLNVDFKSDEHGWAHHPHSHSHHHHHHFHPNHTLHPIGPPPSRPGFNETQPGPMLPISLHHPIMFPGPLPSHHTHEHQNSVSTISNTYPPLTDQNLSDSTNTLGSVGSDEHLYSTLDTPLDSPQGSPDKVQGHLLKGPGTKSFSHETSLPNTQMYFV